MSTSDGATEAEVTISPLPSSQPSQSPEDNEISRSAFLFAVGGYMLCSSLMLLVNKFAVHSLPAPSTVILVQLLMSSGCMLTARYLGFADVLPLKLPTWKHSSCFGRRLHLLFVSWTTSFLVVNFQVHHLGGLYCFLQLAQSVTFTLTSFSKLLRTSGCVYGLLCFALTKFTSNMSSQL
eukprot:TRINITY_DN6221_c0_g2_i2.p1 TRINITY_DN6221_c0_g2~~TRINITY_DN6221_c0_g2_i2.p1  ORF type:complete len:179 (+),score=1.98 TRINITY_DN6221_c0_g2_i2:61-597(+)